MKHELLVLLRCEILIVQIYDKVGWPKMGLVGWHKEKESSFL